MADVLVNPSPRTRVSAPPRTGERGDRPNGSAVLEDLSPLIAATPRWLTGAYPATGGALASALCEVQARQAVTAAAWLRYPTAMDAALVGMAGAGGSARLDWITGADGIEQDPQAYAWRTWVDETVASWAVCLLTEPDLAERAVAALTDSGHPAARFVEFRRLLGPDEREARAAALLRHPDLTAPVASLHRAELLEHLTPGTSLAA